MGKQRKARKGVWNVSAETWLAEFEELDVEASVNWRGTGYGKARNGPGDRDLLRENSKMLLITSRFGKNGYVDQDLIFDFRLAWFCWYRKSIDQWIHRSRSISRLVDRSIDRMVSIDRCPTIVR